MTRKVFRSLARFLVALFVPSVLLLTPSFVFAETPAMSDFGCSTNPAACNCTFIFRDTKTGDIIYKTQGSTDDGKPSTLHQLPKGMVLEYAVLATTPSSDEQTENCHVSQQRTNDSFEELEAIAGGTIGTAVPGVGTFVGVAVTGELEDGLEKVFEGEWDGISKSSNFKCNWDNGYLITEWEGVSGNFKKDNISRLELRGNRGILGSNITGQDEFICGVHLAKASSELYDFELCKQIPESTAAYGKCTSCLESDGIWTAVGCLSTDPTDLIQSILKIGISVSAGTSVLLSLSSGFMFAISQGDPKRTSEAKDMLTSAVVGLLFTLFSVAGLQFIGVSILQIPGFGS
ncbi:MAG TPA: hypothetical protein VD999_02485 [Vitreimonas sp.]|nr:hypothetical protein [Vitreimonas sp.]